MFPCQCQCCRRRKNSTTRHIVNAVALRAERDAARAAARRLLAAIEGHAYVTADEMRVIRKTLGDA